MIPRMPCPRRASLALVLGALAGAAGAQDRSHRATGAPPRVAAPAPGAPAPCKTPRFPDEFRTIDGTGNNVLHPAWGAADVAFLRLAASDYGDGVGSPAGETRPGAREISNAVAAQTRSFPNPAGASDYLWQWGQFLDHDIDETPLALPEEPFDIEVPLGDPHFDPQGEGDVVLPFTRSAWIAPDGVRDQLNVITAFIDASNVYGSDPERAAALRTLDGTGRLATSEGDLLPYNVAGLPNAPSPAPEFFLAGDVRANEQVALTAMHTLFVREHNHWAERVRDANPSLDGDTIYEVARAIVGAEMQAITYREFLPILLGEDALPPYPGYRCDVEPGAANEFATAAYRVGHTLLSPEIVRLHADGTASPLSLAEAFFDPEEVAATGIAPFLRGLASQVAQDVDPYVVDGVRNLLFGPPGAGGLDLAALNIQRGRDHGLSSYNALRQEMGSAPATSFEDVTGDPEVLARLEAAYDHVDDVDAWVGLLCEPRVEGALVGPTLRAILVDQFTRLRDGDRFWYESYFSPAMAEAVEAQTLAVIVRRNTEIGAELPDDVFVVPGRG